MSCEDQGAGRSSHRGLDLSRPQKPEDTTSVVVGEVWIDRSCLSSYTRQYKNLYRKAPVKAEPVDSGSEVVGARTRSLMCMTMMKRLLFL